jgi:8-amino-7-oxononanoate synthase
MVDRSELGQMSAEEKRKKLAALIQKKKQQAQSKETTHTPQTQALSKPSLQEGMENMRKIHQWFDDTGQPNPYFRELNGKPIPETEYRGKSVLDFSNYNYLGFSNDPRVLQASKDAIDTYGTTVGASRLASGERPIHRELEKKFAQLTGQEDALCLVGGFATNHSVIGHICTAGDLILFDSLSHRSIIDGAQHSGARLVPFQHNNLEALEKHLSEQRERFNNCLIVVEGLYSMDGDSADLGKLVELKNKYNALLFVDEAHSFGVLGKTGRGIAEHCQVPPAEIDLWMCTLSKTFASCGGVISASQELIDYLRYTVPGFVYSVGIPPANAAAALKAAELLEREPERVQTLQKNCQLFFKLCKEAGIDTGPSEGFSVIPVITGSSEKATAMSNKLFEEGINAQPIFYPAVAENEARVRFFITNNHTEEQIRNTVALLKKNI